MLVSLSLNENFFLNLTLAGHHDLLAPCSLRYFLKLSIAEINGVSWLSAVNLPDVVPILPTPRGLSCPGHDLADITIEDDEVLLLEVDGWGHLWPLLALPGPCSPW